MRYISTRGRAPVLEFEDVLLTGLARDGGLYLPESWPRFDAAEIRALRGLPYAQLAARIIAPFIGGQIAASNLDAILEESYRDFGHEANRLAGSTLGRRRATMGRSGFPE